MTSSGIPIGIVGRGRGYVAKTVLVETAVAREPIFMDPAAMTYSDLLPLLGGTPIPVSLGGGRDLLLTAPTD